MASRAPRGRMSDAQCRSARGHTDTNLAARTHSHIDKLILKAIVQPTLEAQERMKKRFLEYMTILHSEDPTVLEALHCIDVAAVLTSDADAVPICVSSLFCFAALLIYSARPDSRFY